MGGASTLDLLDTGVLSMEYRIRMGQVFRVFICVILILSFSSVVTAATTQLTILKIANDGSTVLSQQTLTYQQMRDTLTVMGDGVTHYYHQGPVFIDDPDPSVEELLRWNPDEDTNEKDQGAVKGTNLKDLCNLVGGMNAGETVTLTASDSFYKTFAYTNVYEYPDRQGPMIITWYRDGAYPDGAYSDGMKLVFFADDSVNVNSWHMMGNYDWHESADPEYWYYYTSGTEKYPTTTGLSVKYISEIRINSDDPPPPPDAAFFATPLSGTAPLTVYFSDESSGPGISSWAWDLQNDGNTDSTLQNPSFTYTNPGTYSVRLTVTNGGGGDVEVKNNYITVATPPPVAQFSANPVAGPAPLSVQFTDQSTGIGSLSNAWDFTNDGIIDSTLKNPAYTYQNPGTYTVSLNVTNAGGTDTEVKQQYITVNIPPPVAAFTASPVTGYVPLKVQFTDQSTGTGITSWAWDLYNDGSIDSGAQNPYFIFESAGTFSIRLTVTNAGGSDSEIKVNYLTILPQPSLLPLPGQAAIPTDLDGDGLCEDLNGDLQMGLFDLYLFFNNLGWIQENEPLSYFDFSNDGKINLSDLYALFRKM